MALTCVYVYNAAAGEIVLFYLDKEKGVLLERRRYPLGGIMALSPDRRFLYAAAKDERHVVTMAVDSRTGELDPISQTVVADAFAYISVDMTGRFLFGASYSGDLVAVYPVGRQGLVQPDAVQTLNPGRNPHSVAVDASNRFVFVPCLGGNHIAQFLFDERTGLLSPNRPAVVPFPHAAGPRHFRHSPNNRFVYVLAELTGEIVGYALDAATGTLGETQRIALFPDGHALRPAAYIPPVNKRNHEGEIWAADIHITPDGRFVYASERSSGTLVCFAADTTSGTLTRTGSADTEKQPRSFAICPRGHYLVCSGEESEQISLFDIDGDSGLLKLLGRVRSGGTPCWVEVVEFR